jgi:hypothetical protein
MLENNSKPGIQEKSWRIAVKLENNIKAREE